MKFKKRKTYLHTCEFTDQSLMTYVIDVI